MPPIRKEISINGYTLAFETGEIAKQAGGAVMMHYGDTSVICTACGSDSPREGIDFFPLTVDYREAFYAAGIIPGNFFRREGRPGEREVLTCRLIDRPIRPLFPKGYRCETMIQDLVMSYDRTCDADILAINGTSAALHISDIPFGGPIGAVRVGRVNGEIIVNPTIPQQVESDLNCVMAGTADALVMVEAGSFEVSEDAYMEAFEKGHAVIRQLCALQEELRREVGKPKRAIEEPKTDEDLVRRVREIAVPRFQQAAQIHEKLAQYQAIGEAKKAAVEALCTGDGAPDKKTVGEIASKIEKEVFRGIILDKGVRADGRDLKTVRPITIRMNPLARPHGSVLFTRGETQALVTVTLGTGSDAQLIDTLDGKSDRYFLLHYNFPGYSVGEAKPNRGPGRREVGHGALAARAVQAVLPDHESFPYTIRIVSEITESNGSSSMATICGSSLSLMAAGVPTQSAVAGVAMGLISEEGTGRTAILTDILGIEDHLGDMDFKVGGTREGITALQMDIKIRGLKFSLVRDALQQAKEARLFILDQMDAVISAPKPEISPYAPRIFTININKDKVRDVIGPGGKVIRGIVEETGAQIDIEDDGTIFVASADEASARRAIEIIRELTQEAEPGKYYYGTVRKLMDFGAFVEIFPGTDGLVHISNIAKRRIGQVSEVLKEGDRVLVKCLDVEGNGRIRLSMKDVREEEIPEEFKQYYAPVT
ncbi:MAG: polyribonucleotide nucleotidyltransferase [Candidatus Tectomicrobia bacterium]|uniref:Polyribonucleotide nucleotidyltransferase n=1 Tax=Tectimicrobiota bacterium TaxID=2528274 RepID=A0A932I4R6_UNCTE|nr:polyribonucleotide nucleotidyltransferase [Candidatus Tectomicrobia bacterium]